VNAPSTLYREVAFIAHRFHWGFEDILDLEHQTRRQFIGEIAAIERGR
jgi:hypothetical protein